MLHAINSQNSNAYGPVGAVRDREPLDFVPAVPGRERFREIAVGDDQPAGEHHLGHVVEVAVGDEIVQAVAARSGMAIVSTIAKPE